MCFLNPVELLKWIFIESQPLNERGQVRFAIGIDNDNPEVIHCTNKFVNYSYGLDSWGSSVLKNCEIVTSKITVKEKGMHTLRIYDIDANVIVEKIVIWAGERIDSCFGPQESLSV